MTDLLHLFSDFPTSNYSHLLPSLDRHQVTATDLLTFEASEIAKRAQLPVHEVQKLADAILRRLHTQLGVNGGDDQETLEESSAYTQSGLRQEWQAISTLDDDLDAAFGGGIPTGYLTEITGESGAGKTQLLLTLLLAAQLPAPRGLYKPTLYISTEAALPTNRLSQLLTSHPILSNLPQKDRPSLNRILSIQTPDLESQEHILRYQLPVAIARHGIGLVIIDSIAANYRSEFDRPGTRASSSMARRSGDLVRLGGLLRELAQAHNTAVVVANQVGDRFLREPSISTSVSRNTSYNSFYDEPNQTSQTPLYEPNLPNEEPSQSQTVSLTSPDPLTLDHQQRWFTGWGDLPDMPFAQLKTPSLGLVWTNQLACRVALIKEPVYKSSLRGNEEGGERELTKWCRYLRVVFASWAAPTEGKGIEFEITKEGIRTVSAEED